MNKSMRPASYLYSMSKIRFLGREEIDLGRWDRCVRERAHTDVYALSGWLDIMAKRWSGLIQDDYSAVLPVPWNRKYFISYIYTPRFTSPLPLCGDPENTLPLADFLQAIPKKFLLWDLDINNHPFNHSKPGQKDWTSADTNPPFNYQHHQRTNYLLQLHNDYESLIENYRPVYRNLIRQCQREGYRVQQTHAYDQIISNASHKKKIKGMKREDYARFQRLCTWLKPQDMLETWETIDPHGHPCAGAVFAKTHRKLYYLLAWNNEAGRDASASHLLMDAVIKSHAGSGLLLDFEGSDHPGIAHFIKGFGANKHPYIHVTRKRLF